MLERITTKIDLLNHRVGEAALWLVLAMIVFQFLIVLLSKVFGISFTPLDESIWYLNGLIFMLGAAYTLLHDRHVRVDIIYRTASSRYKAWIDFWEIQEDQLIKTSTRLELSRGVHNLLLLE